MSETRHPTCRTSCHGWDCTREGGSFDLHEKQKPRNWELTSSPLTRTYLTCNWLQRRLTLQGAGPALLLTCQATDPPEVHSKEPNLGRGEAISLLSNVKYGHSMTQQKPYCSDLKHSCNRCSSRSHAVEILVDCMKSQAEAPRPNRRLQRW